MKLPTVQGRELPAGEWTVLKLEKIRVSDEGKNLIISKFFSALKWWFCP